MFKEWLKHRVVDEITDEMPTRYEPGAKPIETTDIRTGKRRMLSVNLKSQLENADIHEGDEIWYYESPPDTWKALRGRAGYCVVRNGEVVGYMITSMN